MPRGDKSKYTDKQERKADHIAEGYEDRGVSEKEAERRAWATVNKESGGGNKSGSGRGKPDTHVSSKRGGKIGGETPAHRSASAKSASAKKAATTRKRNILARRQRPCALCSKWELSIHGLGPGTNGQRSPRTRGSARAWRCLRP